MTGYECARQIEMIISAVQNPKCPSLYPIPQRELSDDEKEEIASRIAKLFFAVKVPA